VLARKDRDDQRQREDELASLRGALAKAKERITALETKLSTPRSQPETDPTTGLPTLQAFRARMAPELDRSRRHGRPLSIAVLDIDGFRLLNAAHGYAAGDEVLATIGRSLTDFTRSHDLSCRTGGDEFAVLMPETDPAGARQGLERILLELEAYSSGTVSCISASVGIAAYERGMGAEQMLAAATKGLERARAAGGGRVALAAESATEAAAAAELDAQADVVAGLATALLERDRYTGEHSESVVEMAAGVARELGLDDDEIQRIKWAALLHDIGKVAIPDEILNKAGPLDEQQWVLMREHPVIGERILRAIPGLGGVARIVRHEHESWDGSGYPDGLKGEEIPIGSRIILACDAYHAMTSDRPYRQSIGHAEALKEMARSAGTQFDPEVCEVLVGYLYGRRQIGSIAAPSAEARAVAA
jgi:diguanylate cyclase (GGDEF)-like protein/putative nucleotidyltransferase with HDIG domain